VSMLKRSFLSFLLFSFLLSVFGQDTTSIAKDTVLFSDLSFSQFKLAAAFENKPYFIMFSASWCAPCHRIKKEVFTHPKIVQLANEHYMAYWVDIESFNGIEINNTYKISQLPTILFFDPKGRIIDKAIGYFDSYYLFKKLREHIPPGQRNVEWEHSYEK